MSEETDYLYHVRVFERLDGPYWEWCVENLAMHTFMARFPIVGNSCTYYFKYEADLLAFKLKFGL